MKKNIILITILFLSNLAMALDGEISAFCKRPGTNEVFIGGDFNTLLVMDINTGKSIRTLNIGESLRDLQFSADGKNLLATTLKEVLFINPDNGIITKKMKMHSPRIYKNSPYFADGDWFFKNSVSVYSTSDGSEIFSYTPGFNIGNIGFNADFTELIVLSTKVDLENEDDLIQEKITHDGGYYPVLEKLKKEQSDNKGSIMHVFNLKTQEKIMDTKLPYSFWLSEAKNISKYDGIFHINSNELFIKTNPKGEAIPIVIDGLKSYSSTYSSTTDQQYIVGSTWNSGYIYDCKSQETLLFDEKSKFKLNSIVDILIDESTIYFLSSDFSITEIDLKGKVKNQITISNTAGDGFGVYCKIGYTDPEKRKQQVSIINNSDKSNDFKVEDFDNSKLILIGSFKDVNSAQKYIELLDENELRSTLRIIPKE